MSQFELDLGMAKVFKLCALRSKKRKRKCASSARAGAVLAFPARRRAALVQNIAQGLDDREGWIREDFWRDALIALVEQLRDCQQSNSQVAREIHEFTAAVQSELNHTSPSLPHHQDKGTGS